MKLSAVCGLFVTAVLVFSCSVFNHQPSRHAKLAHKMTKQTAKLSAHETTKSIDPTPQIQPLTTQQIFDLGIDEKMAHSDPGFSK